MIKDVIKLAGRVILYAGVFFCFFIVLELLRGYAFFHRFHPYLAYAYAGFIVLFCLYVFYSLLTRWLRLPRVVAPPELPDVLEEASYPVLRAYCRYLARYLVRLGRNRRLERARRDALALAADSIADALSAHPLRDDLIREIRHAENEALRPALEELEAIAEEEVRRSVRDIMLGVTLSPYHSLDVAIVLYRNVRMVLHIARVFGSRPDREGEWLVLCDTARVVACVNLLNLSRTLVEGLFSNLPFVGRMADDISQGLGAGFFTSASGHAAIQRCSSFRSWDKERAVDTLAGQSRAFLGDVRDMFTHDVLPHLRPRIRASVHATQTEDPGFWNGVVQGVSTAANQTITAVDKYMVRPISEGSRGVVQAGASAVRGSTRLAGRSTSAIPRVFRTFGQRIFYGRGRR